MLSSISSRFGSERHCRATAGVTPKREAVSTNPAISAKRTFRCASDIFSISAFCLSVAHGTIFRPRLLPCSQGGEVIQPLCLGGINRCGHREELGWTRTVGQQ